MSSWGIMFNTFEDLEVFYIEHMKKQIGRDRVWVVGPSLPYEDGPMAVVTIVRSGSSAVPPDELLMWLDKKPNDFVVYIFFGSRGTLSENEMSALTSALELSNVHFILCIKASDSSFILSGFEDWVGVEGL
ncbi:unnamed protein product [Lactuca virosa]|uniref:Uncharacterized protein n=1 Tax=Lactuca virosa TaxID=75947 RepID=A0AAU9M055_9ASTR|nr:unnamed protein product [Lactuca virosa]